MHPCRSWILVGACASWLVPFAAQALVVYKWTDAQGVVHLSDQPVPGAEKVFTSSAPGHAGILGQTGSAAPGRGGGEAESRQTTVRGKHRHRLAGSPTNLHRRRYGAGVTVGGGRSEAE